MATFYTSVDGIGNDILFCGYKNGKRIREKIPYKPTMYVHSNQKTNFKTLDGKYVESVNPGSIRETREFMREYGEVKTLRSMVIITSYISLSLMLFLREVLSGIAT